MHFAMDKIERFDKLDFNHTPKRAQNHTHKRAQMTANNHLKTLELSNGTIQFRLCQDDAVNDRQDRQV